MVWKPNGLKFVKMGKLGPTEIIILLIIIGLIAFFYRFSKGNKKQIPTTKKTNSTDSNGVINEPMSIPDRCPHCMNPNTKGIRICEWCGGKIV